MTTNKKAKIYWFDTVIYGATLKDPLSLTPNPKLSEGLLVKQNNNGVYLKNPHTIFLKDKTVVPQEKPAKPKWLFIPMGMIQKIE